MAAGLLATVLVWTPSVVAATTEDAVQGIKQALLEAPPSGTHRARALEALLQRVQANAGGDSRPAELLVWEGIVVAHLSAARANLSSLRLAKSARALFEAAEAMDPAALDWSVYSLLGYLYANVPGWPLGFRDNERARGHYRHAITLNPSGAEPHRAYGEFLLKQEQYGAAVRELEFALQAPLRTGEEAADGQVCNAKWCLRHSAETDTLFRTETRELLERALDKNARP